MREEVAKRPHVCAGQAPATDRATLYNRPRPQSNPLRSVSSWSITHFFLFHHHVQPRVLQRRPAGLLSSSGSSPGARRLLSPATTAGLPGWVSPTAIWAAIRPARLPASATAPDCICPTASAQGWRRRRLLRVSSGGMLVLLCRGVVLRLPLLDDGCYDLHMHIMPTFSCPFGGH